MQPNEFLVYVAVGLSILFTILYLYHIEQGLGSTPANAAKIAHKRWSKEELQGAYRKVQKSPTDVRPYLFPRKQRRYVVSGGSGLVGSWIVQHLLLRGEDPAAIRILDLAEPTRPEISRKNIQFFATDITDRDSVSKSFDAPWPKNVAKLPLTVFHTAGYVSPSDRTMDFFAKYEKVNVQGVQNMLDAAKASGASCFISTSSASIGTRPVKLFFAPWKQVPDNFFQVIENGNPQKPDGSLQDFSSCYAYSKYLGERLVCKADDERGGFRTGCIRPGHAVYGHGVNNQSSITYNYLSRRGTPSWLGHSVASFVNAQNVSIAHLAYEHTLVESPSSLVGGRGYCCTDPNHPLRYGECYKLLETLAHPLNPTRFPRVPVTPFLLLSYVVEAYTIFRHRYAQFLPPVTGDLSLIQPALLQTTAFHLAYDDSSARRDIGYRSPITTLEGMCHSVLDFNTQIEAKLALDINKEDIVASTPPAMPRVTAAPAGKL